jgi:hypothetical protein
MSVNKNLLDVSLIFQTYLALAGDAERTATAMAIPVQTVRDLANAEDWAGKAKMWNELRKGDSELQITLNRAVNYVQAHRLRSILDVLISHIQSMDAADLISLLTETSEKSSKFTARPLADIVKAAEACQNMTAKALGDKAATSDDDGPKGKGHGASIAMMVQKAMAAADQTGISSVEVVRRELLK